MSNRTVREDVHRPSSESFDPEDYDLKGLAYLGRVKAVEETKVAREALASGAHFAEHQRLRRCGHCGARITYSALLLHRPSGELIYVGETCMGGRFKGTKAQFDALRRRERSRREVEKRVVAADEAFEHAVRQSWVLEVLGNEEACTNLPGSASGFALSVRHGILRWGSITERQIVALSAAIDKAMRDEEEWTRRKAEREATAVPVPEGKQVVTGMVISVRTTPNNHGWNAPDIVRMTVRDHRGFTINSVVPAAILDLVEHLTTLRGAEVSFEGTLSRSSDDETFGFARRPSRGCLIV